MELTIPKHFSRQVKVFKESALGKSKCIKYKCSIIDSNDNVINN